ncbi:hypothetical protein MMC25_007464 [Agyrium rufum]|nr:hypothetical protein [Agyrium rufum]
MSIQGSSPVRYAAQVPLSPLDHKIAQGGGTTSAFDTLPQRIQQSKKHKPSASERIKELTYENGYLREEIAILRGNQRGAIAFQEDVCKAVGLAGNALLQVKKAVQQVETGVQQVENSMQQKSDTQLLMDRRLLDYWEIKEPDFDLEHRIL